MRTKPKDSFTLVVSDSSANIQTTFNPPLYLQADSNYELAIVNLETYYSFANIREGDNNSFKWSVDGGKTWTIHHVPTGCYELKAINAEIIRTRGNSDIAILPNVNTLQCALTVVGAKCKVNFNVPNFLASVLGFERSIYGVGRHACKPLVNIMSVNSILAHRNIIHYSYMRGTQAPVSYNFFPNDAHGQNILEASHTLIYLPVTVYVISTLSVRLTDQQGKLLDLRGEKLSIRFHLRER